MILHNTNRNRYLFRRNYSVVPTFSFKSRLIRWSIAAIKSPLFYILIWCITIRALYFSHLESYSLAIDSISYLNYPYDILRGEVNLYYTPGYPYFIKLIRKLVGEDLLLYTIPLVQTAIALVAIVLFYFSAEKLFKSKRWATVVTIYLGSLPQLMGWEKKVLTESISISGIILLLAILVVYLDRPRSWLAFSSGLVCFVLIMVRPFSVIYLVILAVFWLARILLCRVEWKKSLVGFCSVLICFGLMQGYSLMNLKANGYYGLSPIATCWNQAYILISNGIYENEDYPQITENISQKIADGEESSYQVFADAALNNLGATISEKYIKDTIFKNLPQYIEVVKNKTRNLLPQTINNSLAVIINSKFIPWEKALMQLLLPLNFLGAFILIGLELLNAFVGWFRTKQMPWVDFGISAFPSAIFVASIVGSPADFARLSVSAIPFLVLIIFINLQRLVLLIRNSETRKPL